MSSRTAWLVLPLLFAALLATGCVIVPLPARLLQSPITGAITIVADGDRSTSDVESVLGPPMVRMAGPDGTEDWGYLFRDRVGGLLLLNVSFDAAGHVSAYVFEERPRKLGTPEENKL